MIYAIRAAALAAVVAAAPGPSSRNPDRQRASDARTRDVYVSVQDTRTHRSRASALPISWYAKTVPRAKSSRPVPATTPMQLVLLVDDSQALTPPCNRCAKD